LGKWGSSRAGSADASSSSSSSGGEPSSSEPSSSAAKAAKAGAKAARLTVHSGNVGKYEPGHRVDGIGDEGAVSGVVVEVVSDNGSIDPAHGPGRIVVELDPHAAASIAAHAVPVAAAVTLLKAGGARTYTPTTVLKEARTFDEEEIERATDDFAQTNLLDEGTMGAVYRGEMDDLGTVAIKVLKRRARPPAVVGQRQQQQAADADMIGRPSMGEGSFWKEAEALGKYKHHNIVRLVGHCLPDGDEQAGAAAASSSGGGGGGVFSLRKKHKIRKKQQQPSHDDQPPPLYCLVFEFMAGGSLQMRLAAPRPVQTPRGPRMEAPKLNGFLYLTWRERLGIASDIARGLEYLHTEFDTPTIHQDVKSANVLLGAAPDGSGRLIAKLADFGTARFAERKLDDSGVSGGHHSTKMVVGTTPYMCVAAPLACRFASIACALLCVCFRTQRRRRRLLPLPLAAASTFHSIQLRID
jgi:hypothetical protein